TKTNFAWSFITFAGTQAKSLLKLGNSQAMSSTIDDFFNITDNGNTPYLPALNETSAIINGDTSRTADTKYVVVFFSDGMPNPTVAVQTLTQNVTNIINLVPGRVSFNTVYYGQYNADAAGR